MAGLMGELKEKNHFFSSACHVCLAYGENVELKRCAGCKMIAYCKKEHQKEHWPKHKELCRVLKNILKETGTIYGKYYANEKDSWPEAKFQVIVLAQLKLGRKLLYHEINMLQFPRSCEICHETDFTKLRDCSKCPDASFCIDHPMDSNHSVKCRASEFRLSVCTEERWFWGYFDTSKFDEIPENMDKTLMLYENNCPVNSISVGSGIWMAILSDRLTRPYTFLHAMEKLSRPKLQKMTIHVVGSSFKETENMELWHSLFHHNKSLKEFKIIFVGPELLTKSYKTGSSSFLGCSQDSCKHCPHDHRKANVLCVGGSYEDFARSKHFTKPDYVIGFHLRIHEPTSLYNNWTCVIKKLAQLDCPFFLTSYTAEESKADQERIDAILEKKVEFFWTGENPFSSWNPVKDFCNGDLLHQNSYLTIYEKLS